MGSQVLIWQGEGGSYIVAHPFLDVMAQGATPKQAFESFLHALAYTTLHRVGADGVAKLPVAPPEVQARWAELARAGKEVA